jgi:hypothetical protein
MTESVDEFDDPKIALDAAKRLMDAMGKKATNYIGEWNQLLIYLERQVKTKLAASKKPKTTN